MKTLKELGMSTEILRAIEENGLDMPFPIQEKAIPFILRGNDVIGHAHTGTGKTAAFSLPATRPSTSPDCSTHKRIAVQITIEVNKLSKYSNIKAASIYGGQNISLQLDQLKKGVQIVVATPGRLFDHLKRGSIQPATKQRTQRLAADLKQEGFKAITIHGDLSQKEISQCTGLRRGITDIAARGIDVPAVGHLINYNIPEDPLIYFHRIGKTARAGSTGRAISLVSQDRVDNFGRILRQTQHSITKLNEEMGISVPIVRQQQQRRRYHTTSYHARQRYGGSSTSRVNFGDSTGYGDRRHTRSNGSIYRVGSGGAWSRRGKFEKTK